MNDFDYEVLLRKHLARQASHRKRGSKSKKCPMSTDHMTRKQWEERCGEIMTYQIGKPMKWDEFKQMPQNIQREYLQNLIHQYSTTAVDLARMFGITPQTVIRFCSNPEMGIEFSRGKRMSREERDNFEKFVSGNDSAITDTEASLDKPPVVLGVSRNMNMTEFSLCFEGVFNPEMVMNSIIAMLNSDAVVKLEIRCAMQG